MIGAALGKNSEASDTYFWTGKNEVYGQERQPSRKGWGEPGSGVLDLQCGDERADAAGERSLSFCGTAILGVRNMFAHSTFNIPNDFCYNLCPTMDRPEKSVGAVSELSQLSVKSYLHNCVGYRLSGVLARSSSNTQ